MARTTEAAVKLVLMQDYDADQLPSLVPFIDTASSIIDDVAACGIAKGAPHSSSKLEILERWVAAWAYCCSDQTFASSSTTGESGSFKGQTGMRLESNHYGQVALTLDPTGCLQALNKGAVMLTPVWLGKSIPERVDFNDRN